MGTHKCPGCGCEVPDERLELLNVHTCSRCTPQAPKLLGVMEYSEKAGGVLVITSSQAEFEYLKKPANQRR